MMLAVCSASKMLVSPDQYFYRLDVSVDSNDLKRWLIGTSRGASDLSHRLRGKAQAQSWRKGQALEPIL
jgi:hypothetical protein